MGEVLELKKMVETLRAENDFLHERCSAVQEKEKATALRIDVLSVEVVDLGKQMTTLTLDLEEEQSVRIRAEKDLHEL